MKRIHITLISLLLLTAFLLAACGTADNPCTDNSSTSSSSESETTKEQPDDNNTENSPMNQGPITMTERYLPTDTFSRLRLLYENRMENFIAYSSSNAPYVMNDVYTLSDCRLLSIHIPVMNTGAVDANGDLQFTIYVFDNSYIGLRRVPKRVYSLKINAETYGLSANKTGVYRIVEIPVENYDIRLSKNETLGFFHDTDTLIPAYLNEDRPQENEAHNLLKRDFAQATGMFAKVGTANIAKQFHSLVFDFEWERTYESSAVLDTILAEETAYEEMVEMLREKYKGKYISILGDSISTYSGISNNASFNKTIGQNTIWYSDGTTTKAPALFDYTFTYWGRLINDLEMRLCVNNSWSGSQVIGKSVTMLNRCTELDNDNGTPNNPDDDIAPDVILVYMGINDLHHGSSLGTLYNALCDGDDTSAIVGAWLSGLKGATDFCSTYAMSLQSMIQKYPNAELYCMTLTQSRDANANATKIEQFNTCIVALATYFGATVINQATDGWINYENCHVYGADIPALHPNAEGHRLMERMILKVMYRKYDFGS